MRRDGSGTLDEPKRLKLFSNVRTGKNTKFLTGNMLTSSHQGRPFSEQWGIYEALYYAEQHLQA